MGNINSVAAAIDFEIDRGYRILLDEESFSGETSYQKAIYIPSGIDVALDVRGSGSAELSGMMRMRDLDFAILTVEKGAGFTAGDSLQIELNYSGASNALPDYMAGSFLRMYEAIFPELRETSGWREIEELQPSILFVYPETANTSFWQTYPITNCKKLLYIDPVKKFSGTDLIFIAPDIFLSPVKGFKLRFQRNNKQNIISFSLDSFRSQNFIFHKITSTNT